MKLIKLTACLITLFSMSPVAVAAVGEMDKSEIRDGQLICLGNGSGLKDGRGLAAKTKQDDYRGNSEASSAQ